MMLPPPGARETLRPAGLPQDVRAVPSINMAGHATDLVVLLGADRLWIFDATDPRDPHQYPSRSFADMGLGTDYARRMGEITGREARALGVQQILAPVVDVNNNAANPVINVRSYGEDPADVSRFVAAFVEGAQRAGVIATAKHFPGHGDTDVDSHVGLPLIGATLARLDTLELVPFRAAIGAGASLVMTAHIALPAIAGDSTTPATLSSRIITGLLRDTLGFRGVAITDAMTMEGIGKGYTTEQSSVLAVKAGADILLKPTDATRAINAVVAAVERGELSRARIDSAARHVLELEPDAMGLQQGPDRRPDPGH